VRQYFDKIKALETEPEQRTMTLDKEAAGRFIKHGLVSATNNFRSRHQLISVKAGNNKIDLELAEKQAKERARAEFKAAMLAKKKASATPDLPAQTKDLSSAGPSTAQSGADSDDSDEDMDSDAEAELAKEKEKKKAKIEKVNARSKDAKAAKKQRKLESAERKEKKKQRRQKKEELRKIHNNK